jgi:hypothetical protein
MLSLLKNNNIPYFGGGYTIHEAIQPLIFNVKNKKIAILGFDNSISNYGDATINKSGKIWAYDNYIKQSVQNIRKSVDYIILFIHWGIEYEKIANDVDQLRISHLAIDCGCDIVIGTHPHVTQNIEIYKNKPIFFSIGNFVFHGFAYNEYNRHNKNNYDVNETSVGWALELNLDKNMDLSWKIHIANLANLDNNGIPYYGGLL